MPEKAMTRMLPTVGLVTPGWKYQMNGSITRPTKAMKSTSTATLLSLKNRSTRYLSRCTEIAQSTGPENAKKSQDIDYGGLVCGAQRSTAAASIAAGGEMRYQTTKA